MSVYLPPPIPRPWLRGSFTGDVATIHAAYVRRAWRLAGPCRRLAYVAALCVWPVLVPVLAAKQTIRCGWIGKRQTGKGYFRQFLEQVRLGITRLMLPKHYYMFELFRDDLRAQASDYISRAQVKRGAYPILIDRSLAKPARSPFKDKLVFFELCRAAGLPTARCVMGFDKGKMVHPAAQDLPLPSCDLFVKPARGQGGAGAERWSFVAGTWRDGSASRTADELIEHCQRLSLRQPIVVQEALLNHPGFAAFNMGALSTLRIMTILDESGRPEVHFAVLRMPARPGAVVDNFHAGGLAASVDLPTGIVGQATDLGLARRTAWHSIHPSSGAPIAGIVVPRFPEVIALAIRAHEVFTTKPVAGWDIAVCDEGVVIVEANGYPDLDIIQRTHRRPVGGTRFSRLLAWHVARMAAAGDHREP